MDDAALVGGVHGPGQHLRLPGRLGNRLRFPLELLVEAAPIHELQREEGLPVALAHFVNLDDVGVLQAGDGLGLGAETRQFARAGVAAPDHLEGDQSLEGNHPGGP